MISKIIDKISREISYQFGWYTISPEFLSIIITMRCNFNCQSCSIWKKINHDELDENEWKNVISKLPNSLKPNTFVEINGGEPLIRKELVFFLVQELKKYFHRVALNSNGLLIDEKILEQVKKAGIDIIKISFYSLNKKIHNNLRGHDLAYDNAKKAINLINQKQIALEVGLLITAKNINDAPALIEYLQTLPNTSIILQPLDEKIEAVESKNQISNKLITELWPTKNDVNVFFDWVLHNNKNIKNSLVNIEAIRQYYLNPENILKYRCFAGQRNLVIYPNGDVTLCFKGKVIGNAKKHSVKKILQDAIDERKKIKKCKKYCRIVGCNFSRGLKEYAYNKITGK
jgi:MoaA/NifB/PqqE/SkfB family radical SAM enzyme